MKLYTCACFLVSAMVLVNETIYPLVFGSFLTLNVPEEIDTLLLII